MIRALLRHTLATLTGTRWACPVCHHTARGPRTLTAHIHTTHGGRC